MLWIAAQELWYNLYMKETVDDVTDFVEGGLKGFVRFVREQGVVGLAIGFILGGAVSALVKSLVDSIINPLIGMALGNVEALSAYMIGPVALGSFLTALIDFIIIAAVVYWGFKGLGLNKLDAEKEKK